MYKIMDEIALINRFCYINFVEKVLKSKEFLILAGKKLSATYCKPTFQVDNKIVKCLFDFRITWMIAKFRSIFVWSVKQEETWSVIFWKVNSTYVLPLIKPGGGNFVARNFIVRNFVVRNFVVLANPEISSSENSSSEMSSCWLE